MSSGKWISSVFSLGIINTDLRMYNQNSMYTSPLTSYLHCHPRHLTTAHLPRCATHLQSKPRKINILMNRNSVSNTLSRVPNQLSSITINLLRISRLWCISIILGERHIQNIRPLLERLSKVRISKSVISGSVPAICLLVSSSRSGRCGTYMSILGLVPL
jgi:hypothetical protein